MATFERTCDDASKTVKASPDWSSPYFYALDFDLYPPSVANLPAEMTIAGTTVYPSLRYKAKDLIPTTGVWPCWEYGANLGLAYVAPTYNSGSPLLGSCDEGVKFNADGYFGSADSSLGNFGTDDMVLESLFGVDPAISATQVFFSKYDYDAGAGTGWQWNVYYSAGSVYIDLFVKDGTDSASVLSAALTSGAIYHAMVFVDRSGSAQIYLNGTASGSPVSVASVDSINTSDYLFLGAGNDGLAKFNSNVYYCALWNQSSWLDTHLQAAVAKERFARLCGLYPLVANGTYVPTTMARTSAGYLDKLEADGSRRLYYMGAGWPRVCKREDASENVVTGVLIEATETLKLPSNTLGDWTKSANVTRTLNTTDTPAPDGTYTATKLEGLSGTDTIYLQIGGETPDTRWEYGLWVKRISTSGTLTFSETTTPYGYTTLDLSTCGDGWVRIGKGHGGVTAGDAKVTAGGTCGMGIYSTGATISVYVWNPMVVYKTTPVGSDIVGAAGAARNADSLVYNGNNFPQSKGRINVEALLPTASSTNLHILQADDGTADNRHIIYSYTTSGEGSCRVFVNTVSQVDIACASVLDGDKHVYDYQYKTNRVDFLLDGTPGTPDTSCSMPSGITSLRVGGASAAGNEPGGLISKVRIDT